NFRWMEKYGDPGFHYHAAAARLWGLMAMRLANADVVPLRFSTYARDIQVDLDNLRRDAIRRGRTDSSNPKPAITPEFKEVLAALEEFRAAGEVADAAAAAALKTGDAAETRRISEALVSVESAFLDTKGLPGR